MSGIENAWRQQMRDVPTTPALPENVHSMHRFNTMFGNAQIRETSSQAPGTDNSHDPRYAGLHEQLKLDKTTIRSYQAHDTTNPGFSQSWTRRLHDKALNSLTGQGDELWTKGEMFLKHVQETTPEMRNGYAEIVHGKERASVVQEQYAQTIGMYGIPPNYSTRWASYESFLTHVKSTSPELVDENLRAIQAAEQGRVPANMNPEWVRQERRSIDWLANQAAQRLGLQTRFGNGGRNDAWNNSMVMYPDRQYAGTNQWADINGPLYPTIVNGGIGWNCRGFQPTTGEQQRHNIYDNTTPAASATVGWNADGTFTPQTYGYHNTTPVASISSGYSGALDGYHNTTPVASISSGYSGALDGYHNTTPVASTSSGDSREWDGYYSTTPAASTSSDASQGGTEGQNPYNYMGGWNI